MLSRDELKEFDKLLDDIYDEVTNLGWSWTKLAKKAGIGMVTVYRIGNRETRYPRAATVIALAKAVGFKITWEKKVKLRLYGQAKSG